MNHTISKSLLFDVTVILSPGYVSVPVPTDPATPETVGSLPDTTQADLVGLLVPSVSRVPVH